MFSKRIFALAILVIADPASAKLRGPLLVGRANERHGMKGASAASNIALQGHHKQDCVDDCETSNGGTKSQCQDCCSQTKQRTGEWTCNETFSNNNQPPPPKKSSSKSSKSKQGPEPAPQPRMVDDDDFAPATDDAQPWTYPGGDGYTCVMPCNEDSACQKGGFVDCGTCNKEHGTQGYQRLCVTALLSNDAKYRDMVHNQVARAVQVRGFRLGRKLIGVDKTTTDEAVEGGHRPTQWTRQRVDSVEGTPSAEMDTSPHLRL
ncbi:hypothetical protein THAOC_35283 [Thalassiosira oceanica]|uniref:Uncharacterized protein n=1 Tax=Thalassiosira oceanica TaxID=159749 RepID=K0R3N3_THAOC|nr:hypothetical protein THAOC_35283 [Thalassiosira oceanica]|eukprot:EJK46074.1 hypothetical protein THAOC_35283 [Thalassiosira oceanica]